MFAQYLGTVAVAANQRTALFSAQEIPRWFSMLASLGWSLEGLGASNDLKKESD